MSKRVVVESRLREMIGMSVEIEYTDTDGKKVGAGPLLLIGVTKTSAELYADFVEGWSLLVEPEIDLVINAEPNVDPRDVELFRDCHAKGYYKNLPLNERLQSYLTAKAVNT